MKGLSGRDHGDDEAPKSGDASKDEANKRNQRNRRGEGAEKEESGTILRARKAMREAGKAEGVLKIFRQWGS